MICLAVHIGIGKIKKGMISFQMDIYICMRRWIIIHWYYYYWYRYCYPHYHITLRLLILLLLLLLNHYLIIIILITNSMGLFLLMILSILNKTKVMTSCKWKCIHMYFTGRIPFYKVKIYDSICICIWPQNNYPNQYWIIWIALRGMLIVSYLLFVCASRMLQHFDTFWARYAVFLWVQTHIAVMYAIS